MHIHLFIRLAVHSIRNEQTFRLQTFHCFFSLKASYISTVDSVNIEINTGYICMYPACAARFSYTQEVEQMSFLHPVLGVFCGKMRLEF